MFNCLRTLVFFPSVTFSLLADIEIFPWALLYVLFEGLRLSYFLILILFAFFLSWLVNINISNLDPLQVLRSLLAFLNPLFIFVLLSCQAGEKVIVNFIKLLRYIFWFLMIIGFIQYSGLGVYIDILFNFLVPRASGSVLGGVRGVTLLSSEPSRAGYEFLFICLGYRYFFLKDGKKKFIFDLFVFVFEATIIKSATGTLYTLFYLIIRYYKYVLVILPFLLFLVFIGDYFKVESKGISVFATLIDIFKESDLNTLHHFLLNSSGFRLVSIEAAYYYGVCHLLGGGLGNWAVVSVQALDALGYDPSNIGYFKWFGDGEWIPVRPTSYFAGLFLETGSLTFLLVFIYIVSILIPVWRLKTDNELKAVLVIFLMYLFTVGAVGNPIPWVIVGILVGYNRLTRKGR